jgi:predicted HTH domain antitoxin
MLCPPTPLSVRESAKLTREIIQTRERVRKTTAVFNRMVELLGTVLQQMQQLVFETFY